MLCVFGRKDKQQVQLSVFLSNRRMITWLSRG